MSRPGTPIVPSKSAVSLKSLGPQNGTHHVNGKTNGLAHAMAPSVHIDGDLHDRGRSAVEVSNSTNGVHVANGVNGTNGVH